uniref:G-protein coupled receptors family 1 profile domain-containing protein n=1 Tax=Oryzias latipes TaxID=8090 RepID=A0A3P9LWG6_ORYLA
MLLHESCWGNTLLVMEVRDGAEFCFPQMVNISCRKPTLYWTKFMFLNILLSIISVITVVLNLLVIISISHFRQLHTPTNILLLSLAVSDFLVGLLLLPLDIYRSTSCWFLGEIMCAFNFFLACQIPFVSVGNMILISVDRYMAICHPLHYPTRITAVRAKICVFLCWLWYGLYSVFYIRDQITDLNQPFRKDSCLGECAYIVSYATGVVDLIFTLIFPVTVIVFLYMRVFMVAVIQAQTMRSHVTFVSVQHPGKVRAKRSELKAARTLGVLVFVYLLAFCPYYCYSLVDINLTESVFAYFLIGFIYFNSCLNPMIYTLFYPWFRKAVKLIITLQILKPNSCEINML